MADYTTAKTRAEVVIDAFIGGHTDANVATWLSNQKDAISNYDLLYALLIWALARIEALEEA